MRFWRICRRRFAAEAATRIGAPLDGGRWNGRSVDMVYASNSLAPAAIETFVNLEPNLTPADLVSIEGEIPAAVTIGRLDPGFYLRPGANWEMNRHATLVTHGFELTRQLPFSCPPRRFVKNGTCC